MPKKIDPEVRARAVRLVTEHLGDYPSLTAASAAVARQLGLGSETVRRWVLQADVDAGGRPGVSSEELAENQGPEGEGAAAGGRQCDLEGRDGFLRRGTRPPEPLIMAFIDAMRAKGCAVESVCRVLREQGCQIAARTYRSWKQPSRIVAPRVVSDAVVIDAIRNAAYDANGRLTAEGLYGRRKMTALLRRTGLPMASAGAVDPGMKALGLKGIHRVEWTPTSMFMSRWRWTLSAGLSKPASSPLMPAAMSS